MNAVFADSFYLIALSNPSDEYHADAVRAAESLASRLVTTHYVLFEVAQRLRAPHDSGPMFAVPASARHGFGTEIIGPDILLYERGLELYAEVRQGLEPHGLHFIRRHERPRTD